MDAYILTDIGAYHGSPGH